MSFSLYPHQLKAIKNCKNGCILNGGTGSGKSLTALGYYYIHNGGSWDYLNGGDYKQLTNPKDLYIITTAAKRDKYEWDGELSHFYLSRYKDVSIYPDLNVIVDSWNNIQKYISVKNSFFIFDEQRVVGSGPWVKSFLKITKFNEWILLTATSGDRWTDYIPVFIANGFYRNKTEFINEHVIYSRFVDYPKIDKYINERRLIRLRDKISIDMEFDRHTIQHHIDVVVKYDIPLYRDTIRDRWNPYKNKPIEQAAELCYTLRRIVNSDESRMEALLDLVLKNPKCIIFYNFDYELMILRSLFEKYQDDGIFEVAEYNGHKHQPVPESTSWVYLVQYTAGCEGWNCVKTDTIIFYSQNYSYKVMIQAAGRIDRLNTAFKDLYYYHLKSKSGIDLAISRAIKNKKKFNERKFVGYD